MPTTGAHALVLDALSSSSLGLLNGTFLDDLLDSLLLLRRAKLVVKDLLAGCVKRTLSSVLVSDKHLERVDHLCQWNGLVGLPLLGRLGVFEEDDEVFRLALEVDLNLLSSFAAGHGCSAFGLVGCGWAGNWLTEMWESQVKVGVEVEVCMSLFGWKGGEVHREQR